MYLNTKISGVYQLLYPLNRRKETVSLFALLVLACVTLALFTGCGEGDNSDFQKLADQLTSRVKTLTIEHIGPRGFFDPRGNQNW